MVQPRSSTASAMALMLAGTVALATPLRAQTPLGSPTATFPEDFGTIQTVTELSDGRVLVADALGQALYVVDLDAGTRSVIGSQGQGPAEYIQPDATWPYRGSSTLLVDLGNGRLTELGADLSFGETTPIGMGDPRSGLILALPQGVDDRGHVYSRAMGGFGQSSDSAAILRIDLETRGVDTVAMFKIQDMKRTESSSRGNQNVSISPIPLSPEDAWGVARDGSVFIARAGDYHAEWHAPDGSVARGPAIPFDAIRIGTAEKEEFVAESGRSGGGIGVSVSVTNGSVQTNFARGGQGSSPREIDQYEWPDRKPPLYGGRVSIDTQGRAWVRRHVDAGDPTTYDVFDRRARRVATYTLEPGKRVIGFGETGVYVVAFDQFDLAYLERYDLPST